MALVDEPEGVERGDGAGIERVVRLACCVDDIEDPTVDHETDVSDGPGISKRRMRPGFPPTTAAESKTMLASGKRRRLSVQWAIIRSSIPEAVSDAPEESRPRWRVTRRRPGRTAQPSATSGPAAVVERVAPLNDMATRQRPHEPVGGAAQRHRRARPRRLGARLRAALRVGGVGSEDGDEDECEQQAHWSRKTASAR